MATTMHWLYDRGGANVDLFMAVQRSWPDGWIWLPKVMTALGSYWGAPAVVALLLVWRRRQVRQGAIPIDVALCRFVLGLTLAMAATALAKTVFALPRPFVVLGEAVYRATSAPDSQHTMPSGHSVYVSPGSCAVAFIELAGSDRPDPIRGRGRLVARRFGRPFSSGRPGRLCLGIHMRRGRTSMGQPARAESALRRSWAVRASFEGALRGADGIDWANRRLAFVVRWGLLANAVLIAGNAISRKLFGVASSTMYDVQPHFFAAAVLLMAAYTFKRDEHVRIDVFSGMLGPRGMAWLDLAGIVVVLLPLCLAAVWVSWPDFVTSVVTGETRASRESLSRFPAWIMKGMIPLGFLSLATQGAAEAVRCLAFLAGGAPRPLGSEHPDRRVFL